jgi:hypothetical protein
MALAPRNKPPQLLAHHQAQRLGTPSAGDLQVAHHCATCVQEVIPEHSSRRACGVVSEASRAGGASVRRALGGHEQTFAERPSVRLGGFSPNAQL